MDDLVVWHSFARSTPDCPLVYRLDCSFCMRASEIVIINNEPLESESFTPLTRAVSHVCQYNLVHRFIVRKRAALNTSWKRFPWTTVQTNESHYVYQPTAKQLNRISRKLTLVIYTYIRSRASMPSAQMQTKRKGAPAGTPHFVQLLSTPPFTNEVVPGVVNHNR